MLDIAFILLENKSEIPVKILLPILFAPRILANLVEINGEKVGSPFVINAIGDKDLLYGELTKNGGTLYKLKKYGVLTSIKKVDSIEIDKEI